MEFCCKKLIILIFLTNFVKGQVKEFTTIYDSHEPPGKDPRICVNKYH